MIALRPDMLSLEQELDAFRFLDRLSTHLKQVQTPQHAVRGNVLRETREALAADAGCVAVAREAQSDAQILFAVPKASGWDLDLLSRFIRVERPSRPDDIAIVPVRRRGNAWAALAFARGNRPFGRFDKRLLTRVAGITSDAVQNGSRAHARDPRPHRFGRSGSSCTRKISSIRFSTDCGR